MMGQALLYISIGVLFTYIGYHYADETVFNPLTLFFLSIASLDFFIGLKHMHRHIKHKRNNDE